TQTRVNGWRFTSAWEKRSDGAGALASSGRARAARRCQRTGTPPLLLLRAHALGPRAGARAAPAAPPAHPAGAADRASGQLEHRRAGRARQCVGTRARRARGAARRAGAARPGATLALVGYHSD